MNEKPLLLKFVYQNQFWDGSEIEIPWDFPTIDFINDSTIVTYNIDTQSGKYIPDFSRTKLDRNKLLSYFLINESDLLFVNTHYDLFIDGLNGKDNKLRNAILNFLNDLKNYL